MSEFAPGTAAAAGLASCPVCFRLSPASVARCTLCGCTLHLRERDSLQRTVALTVTAALLYIPANLLPIMITSQLGSETESTILGGVILLIRAGSYLVAGVIFIASVLVPVGKLLALSWLCFSVWQGIHGGRLERTWLYRVTEIIGKWSMTDVFVVAILVALIQLGGLMVITPGSAALSFGMMVVVTMLAAEAFDPRLIWDTEAPADTRGPEARHDD